MWISNGWCWAILICLSLSSCAGMCEGCGGTAVGAEPSPNGICWPKVEITGVRCDVVPCDGVAFADDAGVCYAPEVQGSETKLCQVESDCSSDSDCWLCQ
jgi:hypothetical protein